MENISVDWQRELAKLENTPLYQQTDGWVSWVFESELQEQGIVIETLLQFAGYSIPKHKSYDIYWHLIADEAIDQGLVVTVFDEWWARYRCEKSMMPDNYGIALEDRDYFGTTSNWRTSSPDTLHIGMTGVRQAFTHRGIVTALKDCGIKARQHDGVSHLKTDKKSSYQSKFKFNEKLGFTREDEWAGYEKEHVSNA